MCFRSVITALFTVCVCACVSYWHIQATLTLSACIYIWTLFLRVLTRSWCFYSLNLCAISLQTCRCMSPRQREYIELFLINDIKLAPDDNPTTDFCVYHLKALNFWYFASSTRLGSFRLFYVPPYTLRMVIIEALYKVKAKPFWYSLIIRCLIIKRNFLIA